jgi:hypothetical protein
MNQKAPVYNGQPPIFKYVIEDVYKRHKKGVETYNVPLQPFNGRDALIDAYQEALDLCMYLRQAIYERDCE